MERNNISCTKLATVIILFVLSVTEVIASECSFSRQLDSFKNTSFAPNLAVERNQVHVQLETNATLFRRTAPGVDELQNELAKSIEFDNKARKMRVKLDPSCRWSDGNPITAHDYVHGLKLLFTEESLRHSIQVRMLLANAEKIKNKELSIEHLGVRALSSDTVEFDLSSSSGILKNVLTYTGFTPAPTHLLDENPEIWPSDSIVRISSGPFRAISYQDDLIVLERNPHYCAGNKSNIEKVFLHGITDRKTPAMRFLGGEIDVAEELTHSALAALKKKKKEGAIDYNLIESHEEVMAYLAISTKGKLANKPRIQSAILQAVDRDHLLSIVTGGGKYAKKHNSVSFSYPGYIPGVIDSSFDLSYDKRLEKARKIMSELGYSSDNPLRISLGVRPSSPYEQTGFAVSSMLNAIHIKTEPEFVRNQGNRMDRDVVINAWGSDYPDPENTIAGIVQALSGYEKDRLSKLLAHSYLAKSESDRLEILKNVEREVLDSGIYLPLYQMTAPWVFSSDIKLLDENYAIARNVWRGTCN